MMIMMMMEMGSKSNRRSNNAFGVEGFVHSNCAGSILAGRSARIRKNERESRHDQINPDDDGNT